jgi:hypothetical protein
VNISTVLLWFFSLGHQRAGIDRDQPYTLADAAGLRYRAAVANSAAKLFQQIGPDFDRAAVRKRSHISSMFMLARRGYLDELIAKRLCSKAQAITIRSDRAQRYSTTEQLSVGEHCFPAFSRRRTRHFHALIELIR